MRKKILIVDDDKFNRMFLSGILGANGYQTIETDSGYAAFNYLVNQECDLILLDVMMEGIDGFETCRSILETNPEMPVIMVTGLSDRNMITDGFEAGAVDYIKKPVDEIELLSRVKNALRIKEAEIELKKLYDNLREQLHIASRIQNYMLPQEIFVNDDLICSSNYTPCQDVGGDLFDVIHLDDGKDFVYVADISGHGVQAALLMAAVKSIIHLTAEEFDFDNNVHEFMNKLNSVLCESVFFKNYMTILAGVIDVNEGSFQYFNAGHPPLIGIDLKKDKVFKIDSVGHVPLGWSKKTQYDKADSGCVVLNSDVIYVLFTDGIIETQNESFCQLGVDGLIGVLSSMGEQRDSLLLPQRLKDCINRSGYYLSEDDSTIVAFRTQSQLASDFVLDTKNIMSESGQINHLSVVKDVSDVLEKKIYEFSNDKELAARASIVVTEFLNNILIHGLKGRDKSVVVRLNCEESFKVIFVDKGIEWTPEFPDNVDVLFDEESYLSESGRGMRMIKVLCSNFKRERIGDANETVIELARKQIYES